MSMTVDDLTIITPAFYGKNYKERMKYFSRSAEINHVTFLSYGTHESYKDWIQTHIERALEILTISKHIVLFTDSSDVIFLKGMQDIVSRYVRLGTPPMLISSERNGVNAGGWIGDVDVAIEILRHLQSMKDASADPQVRWREAIHKCEIMPEYDRGSVIFSVNKWPTDACLLHLAGGYTDPVHGKEEVIKPFWEKLGYTL